MLDSPYSSELNRIRSFMMEAMAFIPSFLKQFARYSRSKKILDVVIFSSGAGNSFGW